MSAPPDGPLLALDSSTATGSVAVGTAHELLAETVLSVGPGHSSALLPAADQALRAAGLRPVDLAGIVVAGGPGSFTGLRIAAATAKGLLQALEVPLYAYSGLTAAAMGGWGAGVVCALFDARRRDVFAACYRVGPGLEEILPPEHLSIDLLLERLRSDPPALLVGDGALRHRAELERELGVPVAPPHLGLPRASALLTLAFSYPGLGLVDDPRGWEPDYLRAAGAERIAAEAAAARGNGA